MSDHMSVTEIDFDPDLWYIWGVPESWYQEDINEFSHYVLHGSVPGGHLCLPVDAVTTDDINVYELDEEEIAYLENQFEADIEVPDGE